MSFSRSNEMRLDAHVYLYKIQWPRDNMAKRFVESRDESLGHESSLIQREARKYSCNNVYPLFILLMLGSMLCYINPFVLKMMGAKLFQELHDVQFIKKNIFLTDLFKTFPCLIS